MPGPRMGSRPPDFNEDVVKQAPTYLRWAALRKGQKLRYACRDFIKGKAEDEERLMRRIMIARRNNLRDHELLKKARDVNLPDSTKAPSAASKGSGNKRGRGAKKATAKADAELAADPVVEPVRKRIRPAAGAVTDAEVRKEMDVEAVIATRSYKSWDDLVDGEEFTYNQRYVKGKEGHDWLLKKNIWRRMRYRRMNKVMVEQLKGDEPEAVKKAAEAAHSRVTARNPTSVALAAAANEREDEKSLEGAEPPPLPTPVILAETVDDEEEEDEEEAGDDAALAAVAAASAADDYVHKAVVEAAVKAAESYVQKAREAAASVVQTHADIIAAAASTAAAAAAEAIKMSEGVNNPIIADPSGSDEEEEVEVDVETAAAVAAAVAPPEEEGGGEAEV